LQIRPSKVGRIFFAFNSPKHFTSEFIYAMRETKMTNSELKEAIQEFIDFEDVLGQDRQVTPALYRSNRAAEDE